MKAKPLTVAGIISILTICGSSALHAQTGDRFLSHGNSSTPTGAPNYEPLPLTNTRTAPNAATTENYRWPPMSRGDIDGPQNFHQPALPKSQIVTDLGYPQVAHHCGCR